MFSSSSDIKYLFLVFDFKGNVSNILLLRNMFVDCGGFFFFLVTRHGLQDLSSPTKD